MYRHHTTQLQNYVRLHILGIYRCLLQIACTCAHIKMCELKYYFFRLRLQGMRTSIWAYGQQSNAFKQNSFFTWKVYTCIHLLGHFKLECLTIVRKKVCNLKSKCQNWNIIWRLEVKLCFIYTLSKIVKFSTLTFIFRFFFFKI